MTADAVGGVWTYALDLAAGLARHGLGVTLALLGPPPADHQRRAAAAIAGLRLVETGLPLDWTATCPEELRAAGRAIAALAVASRADLVHLNSPALAMEGGFAVPVLGACHSCLATWWCAVGAGEMPADFTWRAAALTAGMANCASLIAPSAAFAAATSQVHGRYPQVVHNGRTPPAPPPSAPPPSARPRPRRARFVFAAGRLWDRGKNLAVLDRAAALLRAPAVAAGPLTGPTGEAVALRHLRTLGPLSGGDIADWLAHRPVFASPARYEPFGLAVLEAAQAGCPLVLADIPTFRELWNGAALFADPRSPDAFAATLRAVLADAALAERLGQAAEARAGRYSVAAMAAGTLAAYRGLVPAPAPRLGRVATEAVA